MRKGVKILIIILFTCSITCLVGKAEETQYNFVLTIEPEAPDGNLWFGHTVNIVGGKIVISEPLANIDGVVEAGRIRVYDFDGNLFTTIQSPEPGTVDSFGKSFDITEDTIVANEINDVGELLWVGRAHVFSDDGDFLFRIAPDEPTAYRAFATKVAVSEDIIYIAEYGKLLKPLNAGVVQVYSIDGEYLRTILPPNPTIQGLFGANIKTFNDLVYLSQFGDIGLDTPVGPGYVYVYDNEGNHVLTLESPTPEDRAIFGKSVSVSDEYIVVGEPWATVDETFRCGKAYIFNHDGEHLQTLRAPEVESNAHFGWSVKVSGETVVVGEYHSSTEPMKYEGKVYVFNIDSGLLQTLTAPDPTPRGAFGYSIDIEGDMFAISEVWAEVEGNSNCGKVHLYKLGAPLKSQEPVDKDTTPVSDDDSESGRVIPGYPIETIIIGLFLVILFSYLYQSKR